MGFLERIMKKKEEKVPIPILKKIDDWKVANVIAYMCKKAKPHNGGAIYVGSIRHKIKDLRMPGTIYAHLYNLGITRNGRGKSALWTLPPEVFEQFKVYEDKMKETVDKVPEPSPSTVEQAIEALTEFLSLIRVGSVVRLKSGGPRMTVQEVTDQGDIKCIWFDRNWQPITCHWQAELLDLFQQ